MSEQRPPTDLWHRTAKVVGVSFPDRTIELIVIPYETETRVGYHDRMVTEIISRGAFDGIERRANRIRVNRDHAMERTVGRAMALHPGRDEGLVAEVRIARTELGDETLELADEGCLDASAGFAPMDCGMTWEARDRYRITKGWLGHIAMTPDPAYEDARVLAVRSRDTQRSTTPNLDIVKGWLADDRLAGVASDVALKH